jgi:hypothetical protein
MKGKCACLADIFLLQEKEGDYSRLIRENKIAGIACRVAASSNQQIKSRMRSVNLECGPVMLKQGFISIVSKHQMNNALSPDGIKLIRRK